MQKHNLLNGESIINSLHSWSHKKWPVAALLEHVSQIMLNQFLDICIILWWYTFNTYVFLEVWPPHPPGWRSGQSFGGGQLESTVDQDLWCSRWGSTYSVVLRSQEKPAKYWKLEMVNSPDRSDRRSLTSFGLCQPLAVLVVWSED